MIPRCLHCVGAGLRQWMAELPPGRLIMKPSIGQMVHYTSFGTPGGEYGKECRAAHVTEVSDVHTSSNGVMVPKVGLCVINPTGLFFREGVSYHDGAEAPGLPGCPDRDSHGSPHRYCACGWAEASHRGGTWHWPEDV